MDYDRKLYAAIASRLFAGFGAGSESDVDMLAMDASQLSAYIDNLWQRYDAADEKGKARLAFALRTMGNQPDHRCSPA